MMFRVLTSAVLTAFLFLSLSAHDGKDKKTAKSDAKSSCDVKSAKECAEMAASCDVSKASTASKTEGAACCMDKSGKSVKTSKASGDSKTTKKSTTSKSIVSKPDGK